MAITGIIEDGVRDKLLATGGVTTLLSQRIWTGRAPYGAQVDADKNKRTYAIITKEPGPADIEMCSAGVTTLARASLTIGVFGATFEAARDAGNAIRTAINGVRGSFGDEKVSYCFVTDMQQAEAPPTRDDEMGMPGYALAVDIAYFTA